MDSQLLSQVDQRTRLAGYNRLALLLFRLGTEVLYGINVFKVQEIVPMPPIRRMPGAPAVFRGLASTRGRLVSVLDLAAAIGLPAPARAPAGHLVISEFNRCVQGFQVERVERIVNVDVAHVRAPREDDPASYLTAVTRIGDDIIEIIDVERVLAEFSSPPATVSAELISRAAEKPTRGTRRVLVADDSRVARTQIAGTLQQLGLEAILVTSGREALQMLESMVAGGQSIDSELLMVISDVEMPDMDGYTLTTEIRRDPRFAGLYVLLHTSLSGVFNNAMVARVGADKFVPKFSSDELAQGILERLNSLNEIA
ncbi:chemotaxis protein [Salinisphaera sp. P385]|uniref:Chemotaxis protein n=1 Tax=Spectribacter acetivorans TaxID=3075603 RepID=A0ABU3BAD6_9GAMM|nr:chemotaxis protein [Salinisphaera sp. P385]MDT0618223.1 chemotaxis protein [Salinisphaera sp. P385]